MKRARTQAQVLICLQFVAMGAQSAPVLEAAQVFAYDSTKPLNLRITTTEQVGPAQVAELSYDSPKGGRVPAYLVQPSGKGPFGGIVYMHWGQGTKDEWLAEGVQMARHGAISIAIDAPYWRPEVPPPAKNQEAEDERNSYVQMVVDLRRAVDVLVGRSDVDSKRIGYVGHSLGATWGGPLADVEKRIKVFVLMGGLPKLTSYEDDSFYAGVRRASTPRAEFEKYAAVMEPYNPIHFLANTGPGKIYFQWAQHDMYISKRSAAEYYAAVTGPKEERWYFTSHEFNDADSARDRRAWLIKDLSLQP